MVPFDFLKSYDEIAESVLFLFTTIASMYFVNQSVLSMVIQVLIAQVHGYR